MNGPLYTFNGRLCGFQSRLGRFLKKKNNSGDPTSGRPYTNYSFRLQYQDNTTSYATTASFQSLSVYYSPIIILIGVIQSESLKYGVAFHCFRGKYKFHPAVMKLYQLRPEVSALLVSVAPRVFSPRLDELRPAVNRNCVRFMHTRGC